MEDLQDHSVATATDAARRGELGDWVASFLASPGSDNADLAEQLTARPRWWTGPLRLPLDRLARLAGPPGAPVVEEVDEDEWRDDVDELARKVRDDGHEPPPVIVTYQHGNLVVEDGNHRIEALRRAGRTAAWGVVAFHDERERDAYEPPSV